MADWVKACPNCHRCTDDDAGLNLNWDPKRRFVLCTDCGGEVTDNPFLVWGVLAYGMDWNEPQGCNIVAWVAKPRKLKCQWSPEAIKDFMDIDKSVELGADLKALSLEFGQYGRTVDGAGPR
jgi:hypothetical protein